MSQPQARPDVLAALERALESGVEVRIMSARGDVSFGRVHGVENGYVKLTLRGGERTSVPLSTIASVVPVSELRART